ncbi:unnamed protein product [Kluyveromyces dobzhanskii CBS 2104]|uniref:WGS project CCBQ000000000 data, contig 00011 n=1 Tax=Kluyveromyces dobzhanskii CBS 2104 TaxID=1427455 RepID=A0A0A8L7C5_9SACH|nr:unnamed protein product [Kluyveromyces dobzhanskii CBS 2104]
MSLFGIKRALTRALHTDIAFAFDIDGVLLRSKTPIPGASEALKLLNNEKIPYIMLTNGGGVLEKQRTEFLSDALDVEISPLQIVQSHTPFKALVNRHKKVLCCGVDTVREVAETYGFETVVQPVDILALNKVISPFTAASDEYLKRVARKHKSLSKTPFEAIMVFNDPRDWATDIQIISDLLNSDRGYLGTLRKGTSEQPSIPIYFSNDDLLWANHYHLNRFGQGAFRIIINSLYSKLNGGKKLNDVSIGKPTKLSYDFANHVLIDWRQKLIDGTTNSTEQLLPELGISPKASPFEKVYMVGDNPASDIIGAFNYGWESCLVRTGVFSDGDKLPCKPTMIVDNVLQAVIKSLEGHNS